MAPSHEKTARENGLNGVPTETPAARHGPKYHALRAIRAKTLPRPRRNRETRFSRGSGFSERTPFIIAIAVTTTIVKPGNTWRSGPFRVDVQPHTRLSGEAVTIEVTSALSVMISPK